jgi:hypothetical protein
MMVTAAIETGRRPARTDAAARSRFYVWMSGACVLIAVLGFMPTYFLPMAKGAFKAEPLVHIHGILLFSWVSFFFVQSWLAAQGKVLAHRTWGMLGVSLMTAIVCVIVAVTSLRMAQANLPGQPAAAVHAARAFLWVTISALAFMIGAFVLAIVRLRDSESHKRLILLLTIAMLGAPIARWFILAAPPPDPNAPPWPAGLPEIGAPPLIVAILAALIGDLLWLIAMGYDWRTRGRVHPVYLVGGPIMLFLQLVTVPVGNSPAWQAVAAAIGKLAVAG